MYVFIINMIFDIIHMIWIILICHFRCVLSKKCYNYEIYKQSLLWLVYPFWSAIIFWLHSCNRNSHTWNVSTRISLLHRKTVNVSPKGVFGINSLRINEGFELIPQNSSKPIKCWMLPIVWHLCSKCYKRS